MTQDYIEKKIQEKFGLSISLFEFSFESNYFSDIQHGDYFEADKFNIDNAYIDKYQYHFNFSENWKSIRLYIKKNRESEAIEFINNMMNEFRIESAAMTSNHYTIFKYIFGNLMFLIGYRNDIGNNLIIEYATKM